MRIGYFLLLLSIIFGCKKSGQEKCTPEKKEYTFETGKQIELQQILPQIVRDSTFEYYSYNIKDGDKLVFNHRLQFQDCPELADDEGARIILFEIPAGVNSFQLSDSNALKTAKVLLNYACFCEPRAPILIKSGTIEGQKKSDSRWHVRGLLTYQLYRNSRTVDFEADFIIK